LRRRLAKPLTCQLKLTPMIVLTKSEDKILFAEISIAN